MDIFQAITEGNEQAVIEYLDSGHDKDVVNDDGFSAIYWAAIMNKRNIYDLLIKAGVVSDIYIESSMGNLESVKNLLKKEIDVNKPNKHGHFSLMLAAHQDHKDIVIELINNGANVDEQHIISGNTALMGAVHMGIEQMVDLLIEYGADVNQVNKNGESVLMMATNDKIKEKLKNAGAK